MLFLDPVLYIVLAKTAGKLTLTLHSYSKDIGIITALGWSKNLLTLGQRPPSCHERDCLSSKWLDFYLLIIVIIIIIIVGQNNFPEILNFVNCILDTFTHMCAKRESETNRNCKGREGCIKAV